MVNKPLFFSLVLSYILITSQNSEGQHRFEIDISFGYSRPLLEAYGTNVKLSPAQDYVLIDGKRLIESNNFGTDIGYTFQLLGKYSFLKGYLKGLLNLGYNRLYSIFPGPGDDFGIKLQSFSFGAGLEVNPLVNHRIYPSIFGLLRYNLIGGESFHHAGLDFFKVSSRFGYSAGLKLNYSINKKIGLFTGWSYNYDNLWNKKTNEEGQLDAHVIPLRDEKSPTNGLNNDRRVAYSSYYFGISFYLK
ncbi:MAG: hypothetical protein ACRDFC_09810 [Ignavibacteria bacterium]